MGTTLSKNAIKMLIEKMGESIKIASTFTNGSDLFLRGKSTFTKSDFFQIIPFVSEFREYAAEIEHPLLGICTSKAERSYFGERPNMDSSRQLGSSSLGNEGAVLDHNIKLKNYFFS